MKKPVTSGIYSIHHRSSMTRYIGSSVNIRARWKAHKRDLKRGNHHCKKLQEAWNEHGQIAFIFKVIELVPRKDDLIKREQFWIDAYNVGVKGYNTALIAGSTNGIRRKKAEHV